MTLSLVPLLQLERGQIGVLRVHGAAVALLLAGAAAAAEFALREHLPIRGAILALALLIGIWVGGIAPVRRWRHWRYAFTGRELHVAHGWWTQVHTIVPAMRVQHIDVVQGPVERMFGVARLVLHTAGTDANRVVLPGIARRTAEEIRDSIRARVGSAT